MAFFDLPLEQLKSYAPDVPEPDDFDAFWKLTLEEARRFPLDAGFEPVDFGLVTVDTYDVTFNGYGGQPVKGWMVLPRGASERLPCVIQYLGYSTGRGFPFERLVWSSLGYAHFVMDTRGQGWSWHHGDTPDYEDRPGSVQAPGFMTRGILDPETYYYRRLYTDAVRAVEAARTHPAVDPTRTAVMGHSQGGGLSIAAAGLVPDLTILMADAPFLFHFRRAVEITDSRPYAEIVTFCRTHREKEEQVFNTLAYFDGVHFAARSQAEALYSTALMDQVCPPSTVFAAYNRHPGPKQIRVYTFNEHEAGGPHHNAEQIGFLNDRWPV